MDTRPEEPLATPPDDEILAELLSGSRSDSDAEVRAALLTRPSLRERWDHLQKLTADVDRHGAADRALLAEALLRPSPLDAVARDLTLRLRVRRHPFRRWFLAAAVAAAVIAIGLLVRSEPPPAANEQHSLGPAPDDLSPRGAVAKYETFRWNLPRPPEGSYLLRFFDADRPDRPLFEVVVADAMQWTPNPDYLRRMTAKMTWEVEALDRSGDTKDTAGPASIELRR